MKKNQDALGTVERPLESAYDDHLGLVDIHHIELYVNNAKQAAHYYQTVFGFEVTGYSGLETGVRDRASWLLEQGNIRMVLTSPLTGDSPIAEHCMVHGDGVRDIAMAVKNVYTAYEECIKRGARGVTEPKEVRDENGVLIHAAIATYGDTIHSLIDSSGYKGLFWPGFMERTSRISTDPVGIEYIDHCVGNVELGKMNDWVGFYRDVL
ncbi:MAG: VOC family protein, partial [Cyclonatronaceae bacterium]